MEINFQNFNEICRTCFSDKKLIPMVDIHLQEGICVVDVLVDFICSEDLYNEKLPQNVCSLCADQLNSYYKFKSKCKQNELFLKSVLEHRNVESKAVLKSEVIHEECEDNTYLPEDNAGSHSTSSDDEKPLIDWVGNSNSKRILLKKKLRNKLKKMKSFNTHQTDGTDVASGKGNNYMCKQCNKSFTFKYKLIMHLRVHTNEKPFRCDECHLSFSLNGNLKRHKMIHTGEKPHVCQICGKGFIQATSLNLHYKKHHKENVQKITCSICSRVFVRKSSYNSHLKKYHPNELTEKSAEVTEEKPKNEDFEHKCNICGKEFAKLIFLKRHSLRHGEKTFLCSECGKGFVRKADLQSHFKIHTGEKPHKCSICDKSFAHAGSLITHSLVHSGYKPYNCSQCSKSFTQLSHLKIHERTHSGERPYSCSFCKKTFALKSNLTVHVRIHTGETPYLCNICDKGFYDSSSMKKHKLSHINVTNTSKKENPDEIAEEKTKLKVESGICQKSAP